MIKRRKQVLWLALLFGVYLGIGPHQLYASGAQTGNYTYYVQAQGSDAHDGLSKEKPFQTLAKAINTAASSRIKRIMVIGLLTEASEQGSPFARDPESVFYIKDSGKAEITIQGFDNRAGLDAVESNKRVIKIEGTSKIRFEQIAVVNGTLKNDDIRPVAGNTGGGIYVINRAIVTLGSGAIVRGNTAIQGGGVFVFGEAPTSLILAGGNIINNTAQGLLGEAGGGVYIWNSSFTMLSGEISGNTAVDDNGGGILMRDSTFAMTEGLIQDNTGSGIYAISSTITMRGGTIQNNRAAYNAGGIAVASGTFTMTSGSIIGNTAVNDGGGVYIFQSRYVLSGGVIAENTAEYGGGVCIDATDTDNLVDFEMTGGTIRNNQSKQNGGGIFILNGTMDMGGNAVVADNSALSGGGVCVENSALSMSGGASIQNNTLMGNGNGGGIYVSTGILDLAGGIISGNTGVYGGGVYGFDCECTMRGTVIIGNTANNSGGGIFFSNGAFEMATGEILGNTALNAGGGLYAGAYCTVILEGGSISGNRSIKEGGGVDVKAHAILTLTGIVINSNRAEKGGGIHVWNNGVFNMWNNLLKPEGSTIFGNYARLGGGVYVDEGGLITKNSGMVSENTPDDITKEE
jgi:hypothetical protein